MIITILIGLVGIWATLALVRGKNRSSQNAVIVLVVGTIVAGIHFYASTSIRGSATPANMKFFANVITLIVFQIFGLPGIRARVDFSEPGDRTTQMTSGGLAAFLVGILTLTVRIWVGSSHIYEGVNWVDVLKMPLSVGGSSMVIGGLVLLYRPIMERIASALRHRSEHPVR
jgi:hypothetical protein